MTNLDLTSCDFVGDSGCTDPDCYRCYSPFRSASLRTLAKNLATAATLCRAWQLGRGRAADSIQEWIRVPGWAPGCGLEAP